MTMEFDKTDWSERLQFVQDTLQQATGHSFWKAFAEGLEQSSQHPIREALEETLGAWVAGSIPLSSAHQEVQTLFGRLAETELTLLEEYGLQSDDTRMAPLKELFLDILQIHDSFSRAERSSRRDRFRCEKSR